MTHKNILLNDPREPITKAHKALSYIRAYAKGGLDPEADKVRHLKLIRSLAEAAIAEIEGEESSI
jgi:hypothetical protein